MLLALYRAIWLRLGVLCLQAVFAGLAVVAAIAALVVRKVCTPGNPQNPWPMMSSTPEHATHPHRPLPGTSFARGSPLLWVSISEVALYERLFCGNEKAEGAGTGLKHCLNGARGG